VLGARRKRYEGDYLMATVLCVLYDDTVDVTSYPQAQLFAANRGQFRPARASVRCQTPIRRDTRAAPG